MENGPIPAVHGVVRWRIIDLCQWLWEEYAITVEADAEPRAAGDGLSQARRRAHVITPRRRAPSRLSKKLARDSGDDRAADSGLDACDIEIWFGDEARIGQKNKITRRWARRGTVHQPRPTSGPLPPISSAPSAPRRARLSGCPALVQYRRR